MPKAGLLTCTIFVSLPIPHSGTVTRRKQKFLIYYIVNRCLQQRVLFKNFTWFPFHPDPCREPKAMAKLHLNLISARLFFVFWLKAWYSKQEIFYSIYKQISKFNLKLSFMNHHLFLFGVIASMSHFDDIGKNLFASNSKYVFN